MPNCCTKGSSWFAFPLAGRVRGRLYSCILKHLAAYTKDEETEVQRYEGSDDPKAHNLLQSRGEFWSPGLHFRFLNSPPTPVLITFCLFIYFGVVSQSLFGGQREHVTLLLLNPVHCPCCLCAVESIGCPVFRSWSWPCLCIFHLAPSLLFPYLPSRDINAWPVCFTGSVMNRLM